MRTTAAILLILAACDDDNGEDVAVASSASAERVVTHSGDASEADASLAAVAAVAAVIDTDAIRDFREGRDADALLAEVCAGVSLDEGVLVMDFDGCDSASGTIRVSHSSGNQLSLSFEDDFEANGVDLDGVIYADLDVRGREGAVSGALTYDEALALDFSIGVQIGDERIAAWGEVAVSADSEGHVAIGSEEAPLVWEAGCYCPASGALAAGAAVVVDSVTIDLDDLVDPDDGTDDYDPVEIAIEAVEVSVDMVVTFAETCGDQAVSVEAEDISITAATADLEAVTDPLCDAGELDESRCTQLAIAYARDGEEITIDISASELAESAEAALQEAVDALCP